MQELGLCAQMLIKLVKDFQITTELNYPYRFMQFKGIRIPFMARCTRYNIFFYKECQ